MEVKYLKALPKRDTTLIDLTSPKFLSALQILWLRRRWERRKDAFVLLGYEPHLCGSYGSELCAMKPPTYPEWSNVMDRVTTVNSRPAPDGQPVIRSPRLHHVLSPTRRARLEGC